MNLTTDELLHVIQKHLQPHEIIHGLLGFIIKFSKSSFSSSELATKLGVKEASRIIRRQIPFIVDNLWKIIKSQTTSDNDARKTEQTLVNFFIWKVLQRLLIRHLENEDREVHFRLCKYLEERMEGDNPDNIEELDKKKLVCCHPRMKEILFEFYDHEQDPQVLDSDLGPWSLMQAFSDYIQAHHPEVYCFKKARRILKMKLKPSDIIDGLSAYMADKEIDDTELFGFICTRKRRLLASRTNYIPLDTGRYKEALEHYGLTPDTAEEMWRCFLQILGPGAQEFLSTGPPIEYWADCFIEALHHLSDQEQLEEPGRATFLGLNPHASLPRPPHQPVGSSIGPPFAVPVASSGNIFAQAPHRYLDQPPLHMTQETHALTPEFISRNLAPEIVCFTPSSWSQPAQFLDSRTPQKMDLNRDTTLVLYQGMSEADYRQLAEAGKWEHTPHEFSPGGVVFVSNFEVALRYAMLRCTPYEILGIRQQAVVVSVKVTLHMRQPITVVPPEEMHSMYKRTGIYSRGIFVGPVKYSDGGTETGSESGSEEDGRPEWGKYLQMAFSSEEEIEKLNNSHIFSCTDPQIEVTYIDVSGYLAASVTGDKDGDVATD